MSQIVVKNVDKRLWMEFRAEALKKGKTAGEALEEALRLWLKQSKESK